MSEEDREVYDQMAREDKARYELEKASYQGPTGGSGTRKQKDPNAPKRPMSAYLAFANGKRAEVKAQHPDNSNGEISKILSQMWKEAPEDVKKKYRDEEAALWETYRVVSLEWRKQNDGRKKASKAANGPTAAKKKKKKKPKMEEEESPSFGSEFDVSLQTAGNIGNFGGIESMGANPNEEEMMAASALRGVRGGSNFGFGGNGNGGFVNGAASLGTGSNAVLFQQHQQLQQQRQQIQQLQQAQPQPGGGGGAGLGSLFGNMNGINPFAGAANTGGGAGAGFGADIGNSPANTRALLDLGYNPLQQFGGMMQHSLGNSQAMLMAQALRGSTGSYHNQLLGLVGKQLRIEISFVLLLFLPLTM